MKKPGTNQKLAYKEEAAGNCFKCALFLPDHALADLVNQLVTEDPSLNFEIKPYKISADLSERLLVEGVDFVLLSQQDLSSYFKKVRQTPAHTLPVVLIFKRMDDINPELIHSLRIIDMIPQDNIDASVLRKTGFLLQSHLNVRLKNFFENLKKDSFFEKLFGQMDEAIAILDEQAKYIWINEAYRNLVGYSFKELAGRTPSVVMKEEDLSQLLDHYKEGRTTYTTTHTIMDKEGKSLLVESTVFVLIDKNTGLVRIASVKRKPREAGNKNTRQLFQNEQIQAILKSVADIVTFIDPDGKIMYAGSGYTSILGYRKGEVENTLIFEYIDPQDFKTVKKILQRVHKQSVSKFRFRIRKKTGEYIWIDAKAAGISESLDLPQMVVIGASNIQERLNIEKRLDGIESKYKLLIEELYDLVVEIDSKGIVRNVIGNAHGNLEKDFQALNGKEFVKIINKEDVSIFKNYLKQGSGQFQIRADINKKRARWFEVNLQTIKGDKELKVVILKDIHDKKKILNKIRQEESLYRTLTENMQDIVIRINKDLKVLYANSEAQVQLFDNQILKNLNDLDLEDDEKRNIFDGIDKVRKTLKPEQFEININRQGKTVYYNWSVIPEFSEHSTFLSYLIIARNITPFVVARHEIKKLYHVLKKSTNAIIITDRSGNIEYVNEQVTESTGYDPQELIGKDPSIFKSGKTDPVEYRNLWDTISNGKTWQGTFCNKKKNGDLFWELAIISPIKNRDGEIINYLAVKEDITHQKSTLETLSANQKKLNLTLEAAQVGTWTINIPENTISWDEQVVKLCGYETTELHNGSLDYLKKIIHHDDVQRVTDLYKQSLNGYDTLDIEFKIITRLGLTKNVFAKGQILRSEEGDPVRMDGISMDITSQKAIEENLKLRNEELNQFVYKVSHDLRAPLASIRGIIELEKLQNKNKSQFKYVHLIEDRISNLDQFMRNILSHSRNLNTSVKYKEIDFQKITSDCFKELEFLRNALSIKRIVRIPRFQFYSDESRIFEIFRNLISNSIKYLDYDKTEPYIKITVKKESAKAVITFEDNGVGIDPELQNYIFDMFYRANEKSDGSGIGLYIVKQAVEKLNGHIHVKSKKGEGTRFQVILPNANPGISS